MDSKKERLKQMLVMSLLVYHWVQNVLSLLASQQDPVTKGQ